MKCFVFMLIFIGICSLNNCNIPDFFKKVENQEESQKETVKTEDPESVVRSFIEYLGEKKFSSAYQYVKVKRWGTLEEFSSVKAFGGITKTHIYELKIEPDENANAVVFADVHYDDPVNGSMRWKEKFYLKQFAGDWKIVDLKILKSEKSNNNTDKDIAEVKKLQTKRLYAQMEGRNLNCKIFVDDFDRDGFQEAFMYYCIEASDQDRNAGGGNALMNLMCVGNGLAFYRKIDSKWKLMEDVPLDQVINADLFFELEKVKDLKIYGSWKTYSDDDPRCCPSIKKTVYLQIQNNHIVKPRQMEIVSKIAY